MWKYLAHAFFFIYSFLSFQSCLCFLILFPMHIPTLPRRVKWQCADGCKLNTWVLERIALICGQSFQAAVLIGRLLSLQPGPLLWRFSLAVCLTNVLSLLRWARPIIWESETGTDPLRFQRGLEKLTKTRLWRTQWVNLVAQRDYQELEIYTYLIEDEKAIFEDTLHF